MLNISLFIASLTSFTWFFFCIKTFGFNTSNTELVYQNILIYLLPILSVWIIFSIIKHYLNSNLNALRINYFLDQTKKNTEAIINITSILSNCVKEMKSSFIIQQSESLISDINETLSEIIKRSNSISSAQMEHLWIRVSGGERWIIAKTFIETHNFLNDFSEHLIEKAQKDPLLKGSILEFYTRYENLHSLLENYDTNKILFNTIEYGALGKVFNILTPVVSTLSTPSKKESKQSPKTKQPVDNNTPIEDFPSFLTTDTYKKKKTTSTPSTHVEKNDINIEEGLEAIRKELTQNKTNVISSFSNTQSALRNLKQENHAKIISIDEIEKEINASPDNNYDENKNPLGDWLNEKKN